VLVKVCWDSNVYGRDRATRGLCDGLCPAIPVTCFSACPPVDQEKAALAGVHRQKLRSSVDHACLC
jgi:hypothetical protein